jgi:hypothetical protein
VPESLNFVAPKIRENCFKVQTVAMSLEVGFLSLFFLGRLLSERLGGLLFFSCTTIVLKMRPNIFETTTQSRTLSRTVSTRPRVKHISKTGIVSSGGPK